MLERYVNWHAGVRWLVVIVLLSVACLAAWSMRFLSFDASYEAFFSARNPQLSDHHAFQRVYSRSDNILMVLAPRRKRVFTPEVLAAVEWLTQQAWQVPWSRRIDSLTNFQHTEAHGDNLFVHDLVEQTGPSIMFAYISERNIHTMMWGTLLAVDRE